ncbi:hypothetical protein EDD22DRAFT_953314 [Suillus occidentalis]|nr:hypothetical protein EDD22DRAFT_953314 [Suillus occidentalis]
MPLKLLEKDHVKEFEEYGIHLIVINHNTPHDKIIWSRVSKGSFHNLLVAPEQFFPEVHFISTAGEAQLGEKVLFHAAYGKLAEVLIQLPIDIPVALFLATLPQLILQWIEDSLKLSSDAMDKIMLTTNHLNITHVVIPMVDSLKNLSNLDFLVPVPLHPPMAYPPKSLIFIDHKLSTASVMKYLNARLPEAVCQVFKFKHLHSSMLLKHNKSVFNEFKKPDGVIQDVVATLGASTVTVPE